MAFFGSEQALVESVPLRRWTWRWLGELHYGVRMRGWYLARELHNLGQIHFILEVGCSRGQMTFWLRRRFPSALIKSIDVDPVPVQHCLQLVEKSGAAQLEFDISDVTGYSDPRKYDLIVCFDVLEHIEDWQLAVRQMVVLLSPGGRLVMHTPQRGRFQSPRFGLRRFRSAEATAPSREHVREGFDRKDFVWLKDLGVDYQIIFTFGSLTMWLHTFFELYRNRSWLWRILFTPPLYALGILGSLRHLDDGAGLLIHIVAKPLQCAN